MLTYLIFIMLNGFQTELDIRVERFFLQRWAFGGGGLVIGEDDTAPAETVATVQDGAITATAQHSFFRRFDHCISELRFPLSLALLRAFSHAAHGSCDIALLHRIARVGVVDLLERVH